MMMKLSATLGGAGSLAISAVPTLENTRSTSGNALIVRSSSLCIDIACVRLVPGMRKACIAMSPSSRLGMNSLPIRVSSRPLRITDAAATVSTSGLFAIAQWSTGA